VPPRLAPPPPPLGHLIIMSGALAALALALVALLLAGYATYNPPEDSVPKRVRITVISRALSFIL